MFITLIADQIYGEIRVYKDRQLQLSLCCNGSVVVIVAAVLV